MDTSHDIREAVWYVLHYYTIFQHPLKAEEIVGSARISMSLEEVQLILDELVAEGAVSEHNGFYSFDHKVAQLVSRRFAEEKLAKDSMRTVFNTAKIIARFPFVRFVGITGSISKGKVNKHTDFDFFIATEANRLWICRTLLHLYKKLTFIRGRQHRYCMNYFVDGTALEIEEKNHFTAIELSSMIPAYGSTCYERLMAANKWTTRALPNRYVPFGKGLTITDGNSIFKSLGEGILNIFGAGLNRMLMHITDKKWRKKWALKNYPMQDYDLAFKTTLHISKNHPANHQKRIMDHLSGVTKQDKQPA